MKLVKIYATSRFFISILLIAVTISYYDKVTFINCMLYNLNTLILYYGATQYSEAGFIFFITTLVINIIINLGMSIKLVQLTVMAIHVFDLRKAACKLNNLQASHEFCAGINHRI